MMCETEANEIICKNASKYERKIAILFIEYVCVLSTRLSYGFMTYIQEIYHSSVYTALRVRFKI